MTENAPRASESVCGAKVPHLRATSGASPPHLCRSWDKKGSKGGWAGVYIHKEQGSRQNDMHQGYENIPIQPPGTYVTPQGLVMSRNGHQ